MTRNRKRCRDQRHELRETDMWRHRDKTTPKKRETQDACADHASILPVSRYLLSIYKVKLCIYQETSQSKSLSSTVRDRASIRRLQAWVVNAGMQYTGPQTYTHTHSRPHSTHATFPKSNHPALYIISHLKHLRFCQQTHSNMLYFYKHGHKWEWCLLFSS